MRDQLGLPRSRGSGQMTHDPAQVCTGLVDPARQHRGFGVIRQRHLPGYAAHLIDV
ncbi:hypothetical protein [Mycolicibacterium mucogenicum]|uniref:hypothetical protein n=1 Tax=Mycolicibacterium mucogenicum TaxID=56689 RepID=UPI0013F4E666|nr:hypothetical protein [Mycolicibacterium mucogenicum]